MSGESQTTPRFALAAGAAVLAAILAWIAVQMQRAQALTWDEIEFFRATRWIADGLVPYRDYWEHHTPLQWVLFAPVAKVLGGGAGVSAVLAMRWAQAPLWIAAFACLFWILRSCGISALSRWMALALLLSARAFVIPALQYRVDTLGNLAFLAGIILLAKRRWVAFGAVMSLAVLANMRVAPLVVIAAALAVLWREDAQRWRLQARPLRMAAGVAAVAAVFVAALVIAGAWPGFVEGVIEYNRISNRLAAPEAGDTLTPLLLGPVLGGDVGAIALALLGVAGALVALRDFARPGLLQLLALLLMAAIAGIALTAVQYDYHLQTVWLLSMLLGALAIERSMHWIPSIRVVIPGVIAFAVALNLASLLTPSLGKALDYQNVVMTEADRRTAPDANVWDGAGFALRRKPAYRYWFLAGGVRLMAQRGLVETYDIRRDPPAAVIYNYRIHRWLLAFPDVMRYLSRHYVPVYRNLLLPGMSGTIEARPMRLAWRAPAAGQYDVWASDLLAKHPWFARPYEYALVEGEDAVLMRIPLDELPPFPYESLQWTVDGVPVPRGVRTVSLKKGARVEVVASPSERIGVMLVPHGVKTLCVAPEERFVF